jgi:hypothetical protein
VGPGIAGVCLFWPALIWAYGPAETPLVFDLKEGQGPEDRQ